MKFRYYPLLLLLASFPAAPAAGNGWITDFEAARKQATDEKKDLLIDFTGSDWCGWCIKLKKEVFDQDAFKKGVADNFVLVELDFPKDASLLDEKTKAQNIELAERYGIQGYPTIILADALGRPYAETGYEEGGAESYVKLLATLQENRSTRDEALAAAAKLSGVEKAKALLIAIGELTDGAINMFYSDLAKQIVEADPKDETGFMTGRQYRKAVLDYEGQIEALFGEQKFAAALKVANTFLEEHKPSGEDLQHILMAKVMAYVELKQKGEAGEVLDAIEEAAPDSELGGRVASIRAQIEVYLKEEKAAPKPAPKPE